MGRLGQINARRFRDHGVAPKAEGRPVWCWPYYPYATGFSSSQGRRGCCKYAAVSHTMVGVRSAYMKSRRLARNSSGG